jgi:hypothetical protein
VHPVSPNPSCILPHWDGETSLISVFDHPAQDGRRAVRHGHGTIAPIDNRPLPGPMPAVVCPSRRTDSAWRVASVGRRRSADLILPRRGRAVGVTFLQSAACSTRPGSALVSKQKDKETWPTVRPGGELGWDSMHVYHTVCRPFVGVVSRDELLYILMLSMSNPPPLNLSSAKPPLLFTLNRPAYSPLPSAFHSFDSIGPARCILPYQSSLQWNCFLPPGSKKVSGRFPETRSRTSRSLRRWRLP